jgi:hypothetical protein
LLERSAQQARYLSLVHGKYTQLQIVEIPLFPHEIKGIDRLKLVEKWLFAGRGA